jgi:hypothetical protein
MEIKRIFNYCFEKIGGEDNDDIYWYLYKRPRTITRKSFFTSAIWAIWVAGMARKSTEEFLKRAKGAGFSWNYKEVASQSEQSWNKFLGKLHKPLKPKAEAKWNAVRKIAKKLAAYTDDKEFRNCFFAGKYYSKDLDVSDIVRLKSMKLPYIGPANAQFIIRNMGGESIKCDRWLKEFLDFYDVDIKQLSRSLKQADIPEGLFDITIWVYCEKYIGNISLFKEHFSANKSLQRSRYRAKISLAYLSG